MKSFLYNFLFALFFFSFLTACAGITKKEPAPANPSVKSELAKIEIDISSGAHKRAITRLQKILQQHSDTDAAGDAAVMLGQIYYKQSDFNSSYKAFISVINSEYSSPREVDASLGAARALHKLGRYDEALSLTARLIKLKNLSEATLIELHTLRYNLQSQLGDRVDSLRSLVFLANTVSEPTLKERYRIRAIEFVDTNLDDKELELVARDSGFDFVRNTALFRVATLYFEQRDYSRAESYFNNILRLAPESDLATNANHFLQQISARRRVAPETIGAVLPLTGRHSAIAQKTLRGLTLGLGIEGNNPSNFKLAVIDSEANPDVARRAVERLVIEDSAIAIVGDLLSRTADSVAQKADELGVPVIGLSQKSGLTQLGDNVFRNALTSQAIVRELVQTAIEKHGLKRFAILYPNDAYGTEYANLFWDEVLLRGGSITAAQSYANNEKDFSRPISRLVGTFYLEDRADEYTHLLREWYTQQKTITSRVTPPADLLQPIINFDAIFIPDAVKPLGQIASMLVFSDIKNVRLLGTNLWNNSTLVERGTTLIENSLFVDARTSVDNSLEKTAFYKEYRNLYGEAPSAFEAQAYDTGQALRQLIGRGARTRGALRDSLAGLSSFPSTVGDIYVTEEREFTRPLSVLTVRAGKIEVSTGPTEQINK